ncbi:MAG: ATP synthase subunit I [Gammaproteobacteria bacterium]|nr:ATP synthase subunit I [Gammaproteobacteria bacterium]
MQKHYSHTIIQTCIAIILSIAWLSFRGGMAFFSAFLGSIVWIIPNYFFIWKIFTQINLKNFFIYEALKLISSAILIVLALKIFHLHLVAFLSGYIVAVLTSTLLLLMTGLRKE